ncbi:hypothetical protein FRC10_007496 [Ceratobasidium sp. 414]|nr:hypothetical protein FRC10_007496 [Ceratobasidium sp. 414]
MFPLCFVRLFAVLAVASLAAASPVPGHPHSYSPKPKPKPKSGALGVLCALPIVKALCRPGAGEVMVATPVGIARGLETSSGSSRFAVRYAAAARWDVPTQVTTWEIPGNDVNQLPLACPQDGVNGSYSEDCLQMIIYSPSPSPTLLGKVPVLVWIHGGSFVVGSANGPGMDGSALAKATGGIVITIQYRLGVLGFVPPSGLNGNTNLGLRDTITALQFINKVIPSFGGDATQVTVAGQSSGGQMVRALLASPSASGLFKYASIHSDPMDYGFYKPTTISTFQSYLFNNASTALAGCSNIACLRAVPLSEIINAQNNLLGVAPGLDPASAGGSPIRPMHDGQLIQYTLTDGSFPPQMKNVMVMTVKDEAAAVIGTMMSTQIPPAAVDPTIEGFYGTPRGTTIVESDNYNANTYAAQAGVAPGDQGRAALTELFTDGLWRCPSWTFSRSWAGKGGQVYTGVFQIGATYPSNSGVAYCAGRVCHQDDIYILFGTTPSPSPAQTTLTQEIQARYSAFMRTGSPNPSAGSYAAWAQSGVSDVAALKLGGSGTQPAEACDPSFWGNLVQYDYQIFGL